MSESPDPYRPSPEAAAAEPPGCDSHAAPAHALALFELQVRAEAARGWGHISAPIPFVLALYDKLAAAEAQMAGVENTATFNRLARKKRELEAQMHFDRAEAAEAQAAGLKQELAEQEREKLELLKELAPLPYPANTPEYSYEQYFCLAGDDVCLLLWLSKSDASEEIGTDAAAWAQWDGDIYIPTKHAISAFWPHPKPQKGTDGNG